PETARYLLSLDFPEPDRRRWEALTARAREAVLSPAEQADLEHYQSVAAVLERVRERARRALVAAPTPPEPSVAPGILRSPQAFWRDLPELLARRRNRGQWVCYHDDERIGIAPDDAMLIRECLRRNIPSSEYDLFLIEPRELPPWEAEEIEPLGPWHF